LLPNAAASDGQWHVQVLASEDPERLGTRIRIGPAGLSIGRTRAAGVTAFSDSALSRLHVSLCAVDGGTALQVRDEESRNGTWVAGQKVSQTTVAHGGVIRVGNVVLVAAFDHAAAARYDQPTSDVPGRSQAARRLREVIALAAKNNTAALILGDSGTGKEFVSRAIHAASGRTGRLVRVNVTAVPEPLFESEFFGHVRGAFSGANTARKGRFVEANHGTLVLDEIGDLALPLQAKLLRVLEEGVVRPVGSDQDRRIDVRVVASTNTDIEAAVRADRFRLDLFARLAGSRVLVPSLSARPMDLVDIADAICPHVAGQSWALIGGADIVEALLLCRWPTNLRGLRAVLQHLSQDGRRQLSTSDLPDHIQQEVRQRVQPGPLVSPPARGTDSADVPSAAFGQTRPDLATLKRELMAAGGNIGQVAKHWQVDRRQVYRWMDALGVDKAQLARIRGRDT